MKAESSESSDSMTFERKQRIPGKLRQCLALTACLIALQYSHFMLGFASNITSAIMGGLYLRVVFSTISMIINYVIVPCLCTVACIQAFLVKPKMVANLSNLFFVCMSVGVLETLGLLFGEYPPYILETL